MGVPLYVVCYFSHVAFNIVSLTLIFVTLITMCLGVFLLGFILPGTLCASCWLCPFPCSGRFQLLSLQIFSQVLSLFFWSEVKLLSRVWLFVTLWTVAHQAPQSMEFSRQEYWSGSPFPSPGDLPIPGIEPGSPALQADALPSEPSGKPWWNIKDGTN